MSQFPQTPGMHLQNLILDTRANATNKQKAACLKLLRIVVKNLADPQKVRDPKYRQLKLSNEKVRNNLTPCPSAVDYMKAIGFSETKDETDGSGVLKIDSSVEVNVSHMQAALIELENALAMVNPTHAVAVATKMKMPKSESLSSFGEEKKTPDGIIMRQSPSVSKISNTSRMSEKQKARLLMEKKRLKELEEAKEARVRTSKLIKQDKYVRENDENWTSQQSAACVKSGTGINTFRDKYGEN